MTISTEDVRHVARLSRLAMDEDELHTMAAELNTIIESVGKISELDLADVVPTSHALDVTGGLAADVPHQSLTPQQALANAPDAADGSFRVPKMVS